MTYLRARNNNISRNSVIAIVSIASLVFFIVVIQIIAPQILSSLYNSVTRPFWRIEFSIGSGSLKYQDQLISDNENLKRQISELKVNQSFQLATEKENGDLKALLGRASSTPRTLAAVLMKPPYSAYDMFVIDIGAGHGLSSTTKVYADGNILIGRVSEISFQTSKVLLFSSPGQKYEVLIGLNNLPATAIGRGGGQYEAQLPLGANITEGDFVIDPTLNSKPFGIVTSVYIDSTGTFKNVLFAPPVNIYELRWVLLDLPNKGI